MTYRLESDNWPEQPIVNVQPCIHGGFIAGLPGDDYTSGQGDTPRDAVLDLVYELEIQHGDRARIAR